MFDIIGKRNWFFAFSLAITIPGASGDAPLGTLVLGLNPHRPNDPEIRSFARLVAGQISGALANLGALDAERRRGRAKLTHKSCIDELPDGAMFAHGGEVFALEGEVIRKWSFAGYAPPQERPRGIIVDLLTPPSTCRALARGYTPRR